MKTILSKLLKFKTEQKGLTIIELMIAMLILLMGLALAFNFFFFGVRSFNVGEQRTIVQTNVRFASRVITDELRYATDVEIYGSVPDHEEGRKAIFMSADNIIIIRDEEGNTRPISGALSDEVQFTELSFGVSPEMSRMLTFLVSAERQGEQNYQLETEVTPLNQKASIIDHTGGSVGTAIVYSLAPPQQVARLEVAPRLITEQLDAEQEFALNLRYEEFSNLQAEDIVLSGDGFDDPHDNTTIEVLESGDNNARILVSGDFHEGIGIITVQANSLEGDQDLSAEVGIRPDILTLLNDFINDGIVGVEYNYQLEAIGGEEPYEFYVDSGTPLPGGLSLDTTTGLISGTPTSPVEEYNLIIGVRDAFNDIHERDDYFITINERIYNLVINAYGPGTTDPEPGLHTYNEVTTVTIEAIPDSNAYFIEWTGVEESYKSEITVAVDIEDDPTITADFALRENLDYLNTISGGLYLVDEDGNRYIKLSGGNDLVISYKASNIEKTWSEFSSEEKNKMPTKANLEDGNWSNDIRKDNNDPARHYWTRTVEGGGNNVFYVDSDGKLEKINVTGGGRSTKKYLREVIEFPGALVSTNRDGGEERAGTYEDPYVLIMP